jgi:hypothetical protein
MWHSVLRHDRLAHIELTLLGLLRARYLAEYFVRNLLLLRWQRAVDELKMAVDLSKVLAQVGVPLGVVYGLLNCFPAVLVQLRIQPDAGTTYRDQNPYPQRDVFA